MSEMPRREFLEKFLLCIELVLFALFGIRPDISAEEIALGVRSAVRSLGSISPSDLSRLLRELWPQREIHEALYDTSAFYKSTVGA